MWVQRGTYPGAHRLLLLLAWRFVRESKDTVGGRVTVAADPLKSGGPLRIRQGKKRGYDQRVSSGLTSIARM